PRPPSLPLFPYTTLFRSIGRAGTAEVRTRTGTYTVRAGQYLMVRGDEEPEAARGAFSRDRFDIWVADRLESLDDTRGVAARYVRSEEHTSELQSRFDLVC